MGAALTTTGRSGTARRVGPGKRDGKVYECRNQWWNPLKREADSNLVDMGRSAVHTGRFGRPATPKPRDEVGGEATRKACGVLVARLQGNSWVPPRRPASSERGNRLRLPSPAPGQGVSGQARRWLLTWGWDGVLVVVRAWESHVHGEGGQRVCKQGLECQEDRW